MEIKALLKKAGIEAAEFSVGLFAEMRRKHRSVKGEVGQHGVVTARQAGAVGCFDFTICFSDVVLEDQCRLIGFSGGFGELYCMSDISKEQTE